MLAFLRAVGSKLVSLSLSVKAIGLLVLAVLVLLWLLRAEKAKGAEARRQLSEAQFRTAGALVAERAEREAVEARAAEAEARIPGLEDEVARLKKAVPGAKTVATMDLDTGPLETARGAVGPTLERPPTGGAPGAAPLTCPVCLYAAGDRGAIRSAGVTLETKEGAQAVVVGAVCRRVSPAPESDLFGGLFKVDLSKVTRLDSPVTPERSRWAVGGAVLWDLGRSGATPAAADAQVQFRPWGNFWLGPQLHAGDGKVMLGPSVRQEF